MNQLRKILKTEAGREAKDKTLIIVGKIMKTYLPLTFCVAFMLFGDTPVQMAGLVLFLVMVFSIPYFCKRVLYPLIDSWYPGVNQK